ncbi:hypothetical protein [Virgibacillus ainsalahensis]
MKKILIPMTILFTTALLLMACSDDNNQNGNSDETDSSANASASQSETNDDTEESSQTDMIGDKSESASESASESEEPETDDSNKTSSKEKENEDSNEQSKSEESKALSDYSSKEIEYARVWLQLGENQDIDELNVENIPAGEPLNPDDETSASYPEDVIQLAGSRLIDGSVTYSGNGDGTINVYKVPLRWDGEYPAGEDFYEDIIDNTKHVSIDRGSDKAVIELIEMLHIHR